MTSIEILERAEDYVGIHYINGVEEPYINPCLLTAIKDGVAALRAQQQAEENDPLTLEGLMEMDGKLGEPVWFDTKYSGDYGWHICYGKDGEGILFDVDCIYNPNLFTDGTIIPYRHQPKEADHGQA